MTSCPVHMHGETQAVPWTAHGNIPHSAIIRKSPGSTGKVLGDLLLPSE